MVLRHSLPLALALVAPLGALQLLPAHADEVPSVPELGAAGVFEEDDILATVNGRPIPRESLEKVLEQMDPEQDPVDRDTILQELINMEVLAQAAEEQELNLQPGIASSLMLQYTQTLANAYLAQEDDALTFSDEELRAEYDRQLADLPDSEYRSAHILVDSESEAQEIIEALAAGEDFGDLAAERSTDSNAARGGEFGWLSAGALLAPLAEALAELEPEQTSQTPIQTDYGFHVVKLHETRTASVPDFESARDAVNGMMVRRSLLARTAELREAADVVLR